MTLGHLALEKEFGISPRIGWMIDPFGLSSLTAAHVNFRITSNLAILDFTNKLSLQIWG
jgi:hypothetical protein